MNKKGMGLPIKILMWLVLILTFFSGVNSLFRGILKTDLVASSSYLVTLIANVLVGLAVLTTAVLSIKELKK